MNPSELQNMKDKYEDEIDALLKSQNDIKRKLLKSAQDLSENMTMLARELCCDLERFISEEVYKLHFCVFSLSLYNFQMNYLNVF